MSDVFRGVLRHLGAAMMTCRRLNVDPFVAGKESFLNDFRGQQKEAARVEFFSAVRSVASEASSVEADVSTLQLLHRLVGQLSGAKGVEECRRVVDELSGVAARLKPKVVPLPMLDALCLPSDIREEVVADVDEAQKCFGAGCYRSVVILCGRLLETALHRKYFEVTGNDLLETAPGIGLGNVVAKMTEKNIVLDPALSNQIHLINQVRVFSVHKKSQPFNPSAEQAQAMFLYTMDVVKKIFGKS